MSLCSDPPDSDLCWPLLLFMFIFLVLYQPVHLHKYATSSLSTCIETTLQITPFLNFKEYGVMNLFNAQWVTDPPASDLPWPLLPLMLIFACNV